MSADVPQTTKTKLRILRNAARMQFQFNLHAPKKIVSLNARSVFKKRRQMQIQQLRKVKLSLLISGN